MRENAIRNWRLWRACACVRACVCVCVYRYVCVWCCQFGLRHKRNRMDIPAFCLFGVRVCVCVLVTLSNTTDSRYGDDLRLTAAACEDVCVLVRRCVCVCMETYVYMRWRYVYVCVCRCVCVCVCRCACVCGRERVCVCVLMMDTMKAHT